ncbi:uncharacterized protein LOC120517539 [Polypterus senegalus]|uniref:uncharacterized protein LOC120517539 n=1 Tax=Polypterus senegalus TaxID=55291 RepID=UPI001966C508|nr:uncharacterized protein LOC120517539 [Polypterus senegalus]
MIEQNMAPNDSDSPTVADTKRAILSNISGRYSGDVYNYLLESTALDPRFQSLQQLDCNQREAVFQRIQKRVEQLQQNQPTDEKSMERKEEASVHCSTHGGEGALEAEGRAESEEEPASKKTALEDLLGDSFSKTEQPSKGIERETELYRREASIPLSCCPLTWWRETAPNILCCLHLSKNIFPFLRPLFQVSVFFNCRRHSHCPEVTIAARKCRHAYILKKEHDHILGCSV